jgi:hypothetical protein
MTLAVKDPEADNAVTEGAGTTARKKEAVPTAVAKAIDTLVADRPAGEAQQLLTVAIRAMDTRATRLAQHTQLVSELNGFFTLLTSAFSRLKAGVEPQGLPRVQLEEAATMVTRLRLCDPEYNPDPFWRAMIKSLQAECLHLLKKPAEAYMAAVVADVALDELEPTSGVDERRAFIAKLLGSGDPWPTSVKFLDALIASLPLE